MCAGSNPAEGAVGERLTQSLPNFIVIGAMKAGTRSIYEYLRAHPQVFMSVPKELNFFVGERAWAQGTSWYASHFESADGFIAVGEASPDYARAPKYAGVPERMHDVVPEVRLVYLVRHPVDRIQSHYQHEVRKGLEQRAADEAVLSDPEYLAPSLYAEQIGRYLDWFPREQLKIIQSEDLRFRRIETLRSLLEFLGVDPEVMPDVIAEEFSRSSDRRVTRTGLRRWRGSPAVKRVVARAPKAVRRVGSRLSTKASDHPENQMSPAVRAELTEMLVPDVARLRKFMGSDFDGWGIA
jgi:hypothetical protein